MMLPILISVSLAPGSYLFSALAALVLKAAASRVTARRLVWRASIVFLPARLFFLSFASCARAGKPPSIRLSVAAGDGAIKVGHAPVDRENARRLFRPRHDLD